MDLSDSFGFHQTTCLEALYLATMGGALALGLGDQLGSFEEGKCFDAVLLSSELPAESKEDLLLKIITLGDDRNVKEVFVDGRSVEQKGWPLVSHQLSSA